MVPSASRLPALFLLISMLCALSVGPIARAGVDVGPITDRLAVTEGVEWCLTTRDVGREQLTPTRCRWAPLRPADYRRGFEHQAIWLRFTLRNASATAVERWLEVGHPRMAHVQLHYRSAAGPWRVSETGLSVPRAQRNPATRHYNVLPITLPAASDVEVRVRVESEAQMALETVLWEPNAYRERIQTVDLWLALAIGAMFLAIGFSVASFVAARDQIYLMFAMVLAGESLVETVRTGFIARNLWPSTWSMPVEVMAVGSLIATLGFVSYALRMLPSLARDGAPRRWMLGLTASALVFQIYAAVIDYGIGTTIWSTLFIPITLILGWSSFRDARDGDRVAYWICLAVNLLAIIGLLRLPIVMRWLPHYLNDVISPLSTMFVMLVVVFSLIDRERVTRQGLELSRAKAAAQVNFLARMSHELRTPLDIVLGNTQLLKRGLSRSTPPSAAHMTTELNSVLDSGRHLLGMVDEILDYSRGVCGELPLRPEAVNIRELMRSIEAGSQVLAARQHNRFELRQSSSFGGGEELTLLLDAGRVRQVLDNLISNAARHTRNGSIVLQYEAARSTNGNWRLNLEVADTGEGIAPEDLARIFEPFQRVGRMGRDGGRGAGMGLAVAQQLVALMGGRIEVSSTPGAGSSFRFSIMADSAPTTGSPEHTPWGELGPITGYEGVRRRIIVIDDHTASRETVVHLLAELGFEVSEYVSGEEAMRHWPADAQPDAIITDQFMAHGDGWMVLQASQRRAPGVPCILVSAAPPSPPEGWEGQCEFTAVFLKPLEHDALLRTLGSVLRLQWQRRPYSAAPNVGAAATLDDPPELATLAQMVELGEISAIITWAQQLRQRKPQHTAAANRIEQAAQDLDFELLRALTQGSSQ
ncbi:MAG: response regulator [Sinobacteraceae bacterium]|nr:response regulator [Nevskiaceae bacterium]